MKMKTKTCAKCGNKVDVTSKFCPKWGSSEFRQTAVVVKEDNPTLVHKLFYWNYDGYYMLAKSKLAGIASFFVFASMVFLAGAPVGHRCGCDTQGDHDVSLGFTAPLHQGVEVLHKDFPRVVRHGSRLPSL